MSREEKSKGKAAVDLLGSQIGKSGGWVLPPRCACARLHAAAAAVLTRGARLPGVRCKRYTCLAPTLTPAPGRPAPTGGAWLTQAVLLLLGSISASMPLIAVFFTGVIAAWLGAVKRCARCLRRRACLCTGGPCARLRAKPHPAKRRGGPAGAWPELLAPFAASCKPRCHCPGCLPTPAAWRSSCVSTKSRRPPLLLLRAPKAPGAPTAAGPTARQAWALRHPRQAPRRRERGPAAPCAAAAAATSSC